MLSQRNLKLIALLLLVVLAAVALAACGRSNANGKTESTPATTQPTAVEITTAAAIKRELPRFFEATGSLAGDQQTDVAPQTAGKVVAVGVEIGSPVKRGQMLVRSEEHTSELQSPCNLVCRLLLEKKNK